MSSPRRRALRLHRLVECEALAAATALAATACGRDDRKGRLLPGFDADLLAVRGNPVEHLTDHFNVHVVVRAGSPLRIDHDPATSTRRFTLVQSDYSMVLLAQPLNRILRSEAPGVRLSFQQLTASVGDFQETLRQSDGIIVPPGHIRGHPNARLLTDRWVCVVSRGNTHVGDVLTIDDLARLPWVASYDQTLVSASAPLRHMRAQGIEPRVEVSVEGFLAVPSLIQGTGRIAFVHEKLARLFAHLADIRILPSPLPNEEHLAVLYWDANATNDPGHRWFRDVLGRAAAAVDADVDASALLLR